MYEFSNIKIRLVLHNRGRHCSLGSASRDVTRIKRGIANVESVEKVRDETFQAKTIAAMRGSAK